MHAQITVIAEQINSIILGKSRQIRLAIACLLARGHLLIEDVPGVGKTTLAHAIATCLGLKFQRIQFTSDLLPADIIGISVYNRDSGRFEFHPGPVFTNVVLADEVNRATPRAQSALLEAMEENQVTTEGETRLLPQPFFVIATQNPLDLSGTYPLPDSQLDRFLLRLSLGHLPPEVETELLISRRTDPLAGFKPLADAAELARLQSAADAVQISRDMADYAVRIAAATREHPEIERGISTRAVLSLMAACRALALWEGRDFVTPGDLRQIASPALSHRLLLRSSHAGTFSREEASHLVVELLRKVPAPR
jgi:MoxR-like ATPase